jgi:NAD(P)-dependent dehydrogenase (short-subunit alcohol dehydrogenase family)
MSNSQPGKLPSLFSRNNVAVITGAASGIGRAAVQRCAAAGMRLVLFDRDATALADDGRQPAGTWTAAQVVERMIAGVDAGDFYLLCPDGTVSSELDAARILWGAQDMIENRPALSRWHPYWKDRFNTFIAKELAR